MRFEPVLLSQAFAVLVAWAARYGLDLSVDQLMGVVTVVSTIAAWIARRRVSPVPPPAEPPPSAAPKA